MVKQETINIECNKVPVRKWQEAKNMEQNVNYHKICKKGFFLWVERAV